ncbi:MAG: HD domain-containing protein [Planctomycetaceae bacterium]
MDTGRIGRLCEFSAGEAGDCFVLLAEKQRGTTRDGKPYYRAVFRDAGRDATAMIWQDTPWFAECESAWQVGRYYKLRCRYGETQYGPQVDLDRIREVIAEDAADGFDEANFHRRSRFDSAAQFAELLEIARTHITEAPLRRLVVEILEEHAEAIQRIGAASRNHHAYAGGFVEHVLSVTKTAVYFAEKYAEHYPLLDPPLSKPLVAAGAILHDIGKLEELSFRPEGSEYTARGRLIGHILLGRDIVREQARGIPELDPETLLRLEHIIVSHQNLPEWGSPVAPHTPEALLVYYADDVDAKFHMLVAAIEDAPPDDGEFTDRSNALRRAVFRGLRGAESS